MRLPLGPVEIIPCSSVGTGPVDPGCWPARPKPRIWRGFAGKVEQGHCPPGIGDVEDRRAVVLDGAGERIHRAPAVMSDIEDPALALFRDRGLVSAAALQRIASDELHVVLLRAALRKRG